MRWNTVYNSEKFFLFCKTTFTRAQCFGPDNIHCNVEYHRQYFSN